LEETMEKILEKVPQKLEEASVERRRRECGGAASEG